jgi:hypothetical protein
MFGQIDIPSSHPLWSAVVDAPPSLAAAVGEAERDVVFRVAPAISRREVAIGKPHGEVNVDTRWYDL